MPNPVDLDRLFARLSVEEKHEILAKLGEEFVKTEDEAATKARRRAEKSETARKRVEARIAFAA